MLQTQVNYWTNEENKRSHLANEAIQWAQTQEAKRHNLATEVLGSQTLDESRRHSQVTEAQNMSSVNIARKQMKETKRANKAREAISRSEIRESRRHNKAYEGIQQTSNDIGFANVGLGYSQLGESTRSHKATEALTGYSNYTNRFLGTQELGIKNTQASASLISAEASKTNAQTRKEELDWNKTKTIDYDYDIARRKITQGYINAGVNAASNLVDSALSFVGKKKAGK